MLRDTIIRAWRDPEYRLSLSEEDQAQLPENPAGAVELTDEELDLAVGGHSASYRPSHPSYRPSRRPSRRPSQRPSYRRSWSHRPSYSYRCSYSYSR